MREVRELVDSGRESRCLCCGCVGGVALCQLCLAGTAAGESLRSNPRGRACRAEYCARAGAANTLCGLTALGRDRERRQPALLGWNWFLPLSTGAADNK